MSKERLTKLQSAKLHNTVRYAYREVPFYNKLYTQAGVEVNCVLKSGDITKLPLITKREFRMTPLQERTARNTDLNSCSLGSTSGSTGEPLTVLEDPYSAAYREGLMLRLLWAYGVRPGDRIARGRYVSRGRVQGRLAERHGLWGRLRKRYVRQRWFTDFEQQYRFLRESQANVLIAFSSYCKALARHCENSGRELNFKLIITGGDLLDGSTRKLISERFHANVYDHYGIEEVGGSIAWECPTHYGYHINAESLILEFVRDGQPVRDGAGELHVTCFHRRATPIIRYFTGDRARRVEEDCPCGRGLPLMREVEGRVLDYITTNEGAHVSPHQVLNTLTGVDGVEQFKVTQREDHSVEIRVVTTKSQTERTLQDVEERCKTLFGTGTPVDVVRVESMESMGVGVKFRSVESRVTN
jgi:phenylacetate-CoA ligase